MVKPPGMSIKILVFTEGTIFTHQDWLSLSREETVRRVREGESPGYAGTVPIGNAAKKLWTWKREGAEVLYLTSRREPIDIEKVKEVLQQYAIPDGEVFFRRAGEEYAHVAERVMPDIIVEDDCESIGGEVEMTFPRIRPGIKEKIKSIVVKEFGGIDHLPGNVSGLMDYRATQPG